MAWDAGGWGQLMSKTRIVLGGIVLAAVAGSVDAGPAQRIDAAACKAFEAEKTELDKTEIAADIERGAEWGQQNLSPERLRQIARYIFLEEKLTFRCPNVLAAAAVRQMEEQARLKALADLERKRLWALRMKKIPPPARKPETKVARVKLGGAPPVPPLPERKSR